MTEVDFYLAEETGPAARIHLACRLVAKAYGQQRRVFVHAADEDTARAVDEALWTFQQGSFLPHERGTDPEATPAPILIGGEPRGETGDVLVNLGEEVPLFFSRFRRVVEVVDGGEAGRTAARRRYRFYRERGYPLRTHPVGRR